MKNEPRKWSLLYLLIGIFAPVTLLLLLAWWFSQAMRSFDAGR